MAASSLRTYLITGAALGAVLALLIYVSSFVPAISDFWWWNNVILVLWPSFFLMMGYAGPIDISVLLALTVAVILNATLYSVIAALLYWVVTRVRGRQRLAR